MEGTYEVRLDGRPVGTVHVTQMGLYCLVDCRCTQVSAAMWELWLEDVKLGLMMHEGARMSLRKKIPAKQLRGGAFTLRTREEAGEWVSVDPEKPFLHLQRLNDAYLVLREGRAGVSFRKNPEKDEIRA